MAGMGFVGSAGPLTVGKGGGRRSVAKWTASAEPEASTVAVSRRSALLAFAVAAGAGQLEAAQATSPNYLRAYFRYAPRIDRGRDFYVTRMYPLIDEENWEELVEAAFEPTSDARPGSAKAEYGLDRKISEVQRDLLDPMEILATSLGERKRKVLQPSIDELDLVTTVMEAAARGETNRLKRKLTKSYNREDLLDPQRLALVSWERGRVAINQYIEDLNAGLGRDVKKLSVIPDSFEDYYVGSDVRPTPFGNY